MITNLRANLSMLNSDMIQHRLVLNTFVKR